MGTATRTLRPALAAVSVAAALALALAQLTACERSCGAVVQGMRYRSARRDVPAIAPGSTAAIEVMGVESSSCGVGVSEHYYPGAVARSEHPGTIAVLENRHEAVVVRA